MAKFGKMATHLLDSYLQPLSRPWGFRRCMVFIFVCYLTLQVYCLFKTAKDILRWAWFEPVLPPAPRCRCLSTRCMKSTWATVPPTMLSRSPPQTLARSWSRSTLRSVPVIHVSHNKLTGILAWDFFVLVFCTYQTHIGQIIRLWNFFDFVLEFADLF